MKAIRKICLYRGLRNAYIGTKLLMYLLFCVISFSGCKDKKEQNQQLAINEKQGSHFKYDNLGRIITDITVQDSVTATFIFDTGFKGKLFISERFADSVAPLWRGNAIATTVKSGWSLIRYKAFEVNEPINIKIGKETITYSSFLVGDERSFTLLGSNGIFSIPLNDSRAWELDFDYNLLSVSSSDSINTSSYTYCYTLADTSNYFIVKDFPLQFNSGDNATIIREDIMLDLGTEKAMFLMNYTPDSTFESVLETMNLYKLPENNNGINMNVYRCNVFGENNIPIWIYNQYSNRKYTVSGEFSGIIMGNSLVKAYNWCIIPSKKKIYNTPIEREYESVGAERKMKISGLKDKDGNAVIYHIADSLFLYGNNEPMKIGDVITGIDGKTLHSLPRKYFEQKQDSVELIFNRNGNIFHSKALYNSKLNK